MSQTEVAILSSVVAVYPDHMRPRARRGNSTRPVLTSAISRSWAVTFRRPSSRTAVSAAATTSRAGRRPGHLFGGLFGLCIGAGFLVLPGLGLVGVAGPIAAALLAGIEGALAGTALGSLAGALVGWEVPKDRALKYEEQVKGGKFLVVVRSNPEVVARARSLLVAQGPDHIDLYEPPVS
jgi:hypothetical protein